LDSPLIHHEIQFTISDSQSPIQLRFITKSNSPSPIHNLRFTISDSVSASFDPSHHSWRMLQVWFLLCFINVSSFHSWSKSILHLSPIQIICRFCIRAFNFESKRSKSHISSVSCVFIFLNFKSIFQVLIFDFISLNRCFESHSEAFEVLNLNRRIGYSFFIATSLHFLQSSRFSLIYTINSRYLLTSILFFYSAVVDFCVDIKECIIDCRIFCA